PPPPPLESPPPDATQSSKCSRNSSTPPKPTSSIDALGCTTCAAPIRKRRPSQSPTTSTSKPLASDDGVPASSRSSHDGSKLAGAGLVAPSAPGARPTTSTLGDTPLAHHGCPRSVVAMRASSAISQPLGGAGEPEQPATSAIPITPNVFMVHRRASGAPAQAGEVAWRGCSPGGQLSGIGTPVVISSGDAEHEELDGSRGAG